MTDRPPRQTEYHVLLALAEGPRYGYEICGRAAEDSEGAVRLHAGSLYRILARLMDSGLVEEVEVDGIEESHPGLPRRYYRLTATGLMVVREESARLVRVGQRARQRALLAEGGDV